MAPTPTSRSKAGAKKRVTVKKTKPGAKARVMPKFTKPSDALVETFNRAIADLTNVEPRRMFGYPAAFTKGQMFASLFQDNMILRLSEVDRQVLGEEGARPFEPMPGRPMKEYVVVPPPILESQSALHTWLLKARGYAASLPSRKKR